MDLAGRSEAGERLPLSVFIIARDEADRIGAVIRAVRDWVDEVIVVDSGSRDATVALATELGARVVHHDWEGYGRQKRFAEEQCRNDWLLNLDADEVVPPDLAAAIRAEFRPGSGPAADGYRLGIAEIFPGEARPHRFAYTLWPVRLYRRSRGRYAISPVHDRVEMAPEARIETLAGRIHHFSVRSLGDQLAKLNRYSDQQADDLEARGVTMPILRLFLEFPAAFLKAYLGRRHAARGVYGFLTAMNYAISRHLRVAKTYERRRLREAEARGTTEGARRFPPDSP